MRRLRNAPSSAAALGVIAAIVVSAQLAAPGVATALPGLEFKIALPAPFNDEPIKTAIAACDRDQHVIGGGAQINDGGRKLVRLIAMEGHKGFGTNLDVFRVVAEAPGLQRTFDWQVIPYAICADKAYLDEHRYQVVNNNPTDVPASGGPFAQSTARCPSGTVAYSAGATLDVAGTNNGLSAKGLIGLQMVRTSGPLDIARATGREDNVGIREAWTLRAYAICAEPEGGVHSEGRLATGNSAGGRCSGDTFVHGVGGGGGTVDGGPVWLRMVYPDPGLKNYHVQTTATFPDGLLSIQPTWRLSRSS